MDLEGKVAIVTGASRGIGREIARAFAAEGASLVLAARSAGALDELAEELCGRGTTVVTVPTDMTRSDQVERLADTAMRLRGRIDVMVNNAGLAGPTVGIVDLDPGAWAEVLESNLTTCYLGCRAVVPAMMAQRSGAIINLSSISGKRPLLFRAGYCAAKMGVIGLTRELALELGPHGITVNAICPGSVTGERIDAVIAAQARARGLSTDEVAREFAASSPLGRLVPPEDVAAMAVYLAGPHGRSITGEDVNVNAGVAMY